MVSRLGGLELDQVSFPGRGRRALRASPSRDSPWACKGVGDWRELQGPELGLPGLEEAKRWTDGSSPLSL